MFQKVSYFKFLNSITCGSLPSVTPLHHEFYLVHFYRMSWSSVPEILYRILLVNNHLVKYSTWFVVPINCSRCSITSLYHYVDFFQLGPGLVTIVYIFSNFDAIHLDLPSFKRFGKLLRLMLRITFGITTEACAPYRV